MQPQGSGGSGSRVKEAHKPEKTIYDEPEPAWSKFWASYKHIIIGAAIVALLLLWLLAVLHSRSVALPKSTGQPDFPCCKKRLHGLVANHAWGSLQAMSDTGKLERLWLGADAVFGWFCNP